MTVAVNCFFDPTRQRLMVKVLPGEFYVTGGEELVATTLGSCVCACIWDPVAKVGGLNHFMLPEDKGSMGPLSQSNRYGVHAMESLINGLLHLGAARSRLQVKLAGGGQVFGQGNVGDMNVDFVKRFVARERLALVGESLGGLYPRKVLFEPATGLAWIKQLKRLANDTLQVREEALAKRGAGQPKAVELFS